MCIQVIYMISFHKLCKTGKWMTISTQEKILELYSATPSIKTSSESWLLTDWEQGGRLSYIKI